MRRREVVFSLSVMAGAVLAGCGGGGSDTEEKPIPGLWSTYRGGSIALGKGSITITFDLTYGHLLGLATKDLTDPTRQKNDPMRIIKPVEVKEVVFASAILGGPESSPARAPFVATGVVVLPNIAGSDGAGWFFVVLYTGEIIPLAMGPDLIKSRYAITSQTDIVIGEDGSLTYGDYRLGKVELTGTTATIRFGADVLGGLSGFARPADVAYGQWNSDTTGWLNDGTIRATVQTDARGDAFIEFSDMLNNDLGTFSFHLKTGGVLWFDAKSKRWESLGGMELVEVTGGTHLRYGGYRLGSITRPTSDMIRVAFGVNLFHSLTDDATGKAIFPKLGEIAYFQFVSALTGWYGSPAKGMPTVQENGDYVVDITGVPNNDHGYVKVFLTDGRRLSLNPNSARFKGSGAKASSVGSWLV